MKYGRESPHSATVSIHIEGATVAVQSLKDLEFAARRRVVSAAVRASNRAIVAEAKKLAPVGTGLLRKQIRGTVQMDRSSGRVYGYVRARASTAQKTKGVTNAARYVHLVVGGAKAHAIERKDKNLAVGTGFFTRVWHPGIKPRPFMEQAASAAFGQAISDFSEKFEEALVKETTKIYNANRAKAAAFAAIGARF